MCPFCSPDYSFHANKMVYLIICVLVLGQIETTMNDFIQLKTQSNVSGSETMVED